MPAGSWFLLVVPACVHTGAPVGTASLAIAPTPQPPACTRGGFGRWRAASSPALPRPFAVTPGASPLWFLVPPLSCPPPLASLVRAVGGARGRAAPPPRRVTSRPFAPSCLCWVSFSPLRPLVWFLLVVPVCSLVPCGASAVPARRSLRFPFRRVRSAVRLRFRFRPRLPPGSAGFPGGAVARRLPPPSRESGKFFSCAPLSVAWLCSLGI